VWKAVRSGTWANDIDLSKSTSDCCCSTGNSYMNGLGI
jgi:hypothetical protein